MIDLLPVNDGPQDNINLLCAILKYVCPEVCMYSTRTSIISFYFVQFPIVSLLS